LHGGGPGFESPRLHCRARTIRHCAAYAGGMWKRGSSGRAAAGGATRGRGRTDDNFTYGEYGKRCDEARVAAGTSPGERAGTGMVLGGSGVPFGVSGRESWGRSTKMSAWWMPRRLLPMKDAATQRNALGTSWQRVIQGYPNGATHHRQR
jgi:hypothetical protein